MWSKLRVILSFMTESIWTTNDKWITEGVYSSYHMYSGNYPIKTGKISDVQLSPIITCKKLLEILTPYSKQIGCQKWYKQTHVWITQGWQSSDLPLCLHYIQRYTCVSDYF